MRVGDQMIASASSVRAMPKVMVRTFPA